MARLPGSPLRYTAASAVLLLSAVEAGPGSGGDLSGGCNVTLTQQISATKCVRNVNFGCNANSQTMWIKRYVRCCDGSLYGRAAVRALSSGVLLEMAARP